MTKTVPSRIALFPAEDVPVVVAVLRVRSKWWHVVRITEDGTVERGSWFRGAKIMVDSVTVNHDGTLMAYIATADAHTAWSGLCRPPWLRCIAQVHEPMPFMSKPAFHFPAPGCVSLTRNGTASEIDNATREEVERLLAGFMDKDMVGIALAKVESDSQRQVHDLEQAKIKIHALGQRLGPTRLLSRTLKEEKSDRMLCQGFCQLEGTSSWSWTGPDGVVRQIAERAWDNHDPGTRHHLSCCVDAAGRWWEAVAGRITCDRIGKLGAERLLDIDTATWNPPERTKAVP